MATQTTTTSSFFSLNWQDAFRGFLIAAITAVIATVGQSINAGNLPTLAELKIAGLAGLTAGISYIIKNLFTASEITIKNPPSETMKAVKAGTATVTVTTL